MVKIFDERVVGRGLSEFEVSDPARSEKFLRSGRPQALTECLKFTGVVSEFKKFGRKGFDQVTVLPDKSHDLVNDRL